MGVILKIGSKIWGATPHKILGAQTPQCWKPKSEYAVQTYCRNRPCERVSKTGFKILGAPPKKIWGGRVKVQKLRYWNSPCSGVTGHTHFKFLQVVVGHDVLCTPWGPSPPKKIWRANFFPNPLGSGGMVQNFSGNSPWKEVPKTGFKILGAPSPKKIWGGQN